jgi:hypothetical protein
LFSYCKFLKYVKYIPTYNILYFLLIYLIFKKIEKNRSFKVHYYYSLMDSYQELASTLGDPPKSDLDLDIDLWTDLDKKYGISYVEYKGSTFADSPSEYNDCFCFDDCPSEYSDNDNDSDYPDKEDARKHYNNKQKYVIINNRTCIWKPKTIARSDRTVLIKLQNAVIDRLTILGFKMGRCWYIGPEYLKMKNEYYRIYKREYILLQKKLGFI